MMKRIVLTMVVGIAAIALISTQATAQVGGVCSNCHTMHNSQAGVSVTGGAPLETLLNDDCLGCHTGTDDPLRGATNSTPCVISSSTQFTDDLCLAGGFFGVMTPLDNNGNEQHDIGSIVDPAGFNAAETTWYTGGANGLGCAGSNGCHGNQSDVSDMAAIAGGHHDTSSTYRMLYVGGNTVAGLGAPDYEEELISAGTPTTAMAHNIYSAGTGTGDGRSISELCAKCHGDFHNENGSTEDCGGSSPWVRHPTDVLIPTGWEIITSGVSGSDLKNNPVGYADADDDNAEQATCLSCHRAHGTENDDLLRWAYSTQQAGSAVDYGCLGCHDAQRAP